jgi:hypothetical protein
MGVKYSSKKFVINLLGLMVRFFYKHAESLGGFTTQNENGTMHNGL